MYISSDIIIAKKGTTSQLYKEKERRKERKTSFLAINTYVCVRRGMLIIGFFCMGCNRELIILTILFIFLLVESFLHWLLIIVVSHFI